MEELGRSAINQKTERSFGYIYRTAKLAYRPFGKRVIKERVGHYMKGRGVTVQKRKWVCVKVECVLTYD